MGGSHDDRLRRKYTISGAGGAFDAVWRPSAEDAKIAWESTKLLIVPAPSPDAGPGVIDFDAGTVEIDASRTPGNDEGPAEAGPS